MRTDETLEFLRERGNKGVSAEELGEKFGFKISGSSSKLINQLRDAGHNIISDRKLGVYILKEKNAKISKESDTTTIDNSLFKALGKKDRVLECLQRAGTEGASAEELAKHAGIEEKNIAYHIHALRNKDGKKIFLVEGKYCLKAPKNNKSASYGKGLEDLPEVTESTNFVSIIGNKRLSDGIDKVRPEDKAAYLDLLKKVVYYSKCALAMLEASEMINSITIGDLQ